MRDPAAVIAGPDVAAREKVPPAGDAPAQARRDPQLFEDLRHQFEDLRHQFEDLRHQLRPPLLMALQATQRALTRRDLSREVEEDLLTIRSLCRRVARAERAAAFASDDSAAAISTVRTRVALPELFDMISDAVEDFRSLVNRGRGVGMELDGSGFVGESSWLNIDTDLVDIAVRNLLDNAVKYGFANESVKVSGRREGREFVISVENRGIVLSATDARRIPTRGWRGSEASLVTGEGSGLGLWIADRIMRSHDGRLAVYPTSTAGVTRVALILPVEASHEDSSDRG